MESSPIPRDFTVSFLLQGGKAGSQVGNKNSVEHLALQIEVGSLSEGQGFGRPRLGHPGCSVSAEFPNGELTVPVLNTPGSLRPWSLGETKRFPGECILPPFIPDTELCVYLCTKCYFVSTVGRAGGGVNLSFMLVTLLYCPHKSYWHHLTQGTGSHGAH